MKKRKEILEGLFSKVLEAHSKSEGKRLYYQLINQAEKEIEDFSLKLLAEYERWLFDIRFPMLKSTYATDFKGVSFIGEFLKEHAVSEMFEKELINQLAFEKFCSIMCEYMPSNAEDSDNPEWSRGELKKAYDELVRSGIIKV